jgi:hypothetical protein
VVPNFIIVGVSRAGTTMVFNTLARHPEILSSSTKETRYFQAVRYGETLRPLSEYEAYFRRYSGQPIAMECTPDYFFGAAPTATAIKAVCDPRVAVILREPTSRLISFFQLMQGRLQVPATMTLTEYVSRCQAIPADAMNDRANNNYTALWGGQYARFLPAWLEAFPGRCDVFFYDDLRADAMALMAEQCRRLGVDPTALPNAAVVDNSAPSYRSPAMQRAAAFAARRGRAILHRYPKVYETARRSYEAVNKSPDPPETAVPEPLRRQIEAIYRPWNEQLRDQLVSAGVTRLPEWLQ